MSSVQYTDGHSGLSVPGSLYNTKLPGVKLVIEALPTVLQSFGIRATWDGEE